MNYLLNEDHLLAKFILLKILNLLLVIVGFDPTFTFDWILTYHFIYLKNFIFIIKNKIQIHQLLILNLRIKNQHIYQLKTNQMLTGYV